MYKALLYPERIRRSERSGGGSLFYTNENWRIGASSLSRRAPTRLGRSLDRMPHRCDAILLWSTVHLVLFSLGLFLGRFLSAVS
jgi:hypothetical protein